MTPLKPCFAHNYSYLLYMSAAIRIAVEGTIMQHVRASLAGA
jgi:hypothetical protein